jgi:cardiolipin synthase (CMP-forming)
VDHRGETREIAWNPDPGHHLRWADYVPDRPGSAWPLKAYVGMSSAVIEPIQKLPSLRKWVPNLLTASRIPLALLYPRAARVQYGSLMLLSIAALTDMLDGFLARRWNATSPAGAMLDGLADKIFAVEVVATLVRSKRLSSRQACALFIREGIELAIALETLFHPDSRTTWKQRKQAGTLGKLTTILQALTCLGAHLGWPKVSRTGVWLTALAGTLTGGGYQLREYAWRHRSSLPPAVRNVVGPYDLRSW